MFVEFANLKETTQLFSILPDSFRVLFDSQSFRVIGDGRELPLRGLKLGVIVDVRLKKKKERNLIFNNIFRYLTIETKSLCLEK